MSMYEILNCFEFVAFMIEFYRWDMVLDIDEMQ